MSDLLSGYRESLKKLRPRMPTMADLLKRRSSPRFTPYQQELIPYVQEAQEERKEERKRFRPVQQLFDLLSRGQYFTANIAKEITDSARTGESLTQGAKDAVVGAWKGITGQQKGTWEDVFFGEGGWMGETPEEERGFAKKGLGFLANVLLDPLTYVSLGTAGFAKGAIGAASKYADDAVKYVMRAEPEKFIKKLGLEINDMSSDKIAAALKRARGSAAEKEISKVYNKAYREALTTPQAKLSLPTGGVYKDAGQRSFRVLGKEVFKGKELPFWASQLADPLFAGKELGKKLGLGKAFNTMKNMVSSATPTLSKKFTDAWWAITQNPRSPIAVIKNKLGLFRTPYQQALHNKKIEADHLSHYVFNSSMAKINQAFKDVDEVDLDFIRKARNNAQTAGREVGDEGLTTDYFLRQDGKEELIEVNSKINKVLKEMRDEELSLAKEGIIPEYNEEFEYLVSYITPEAKEAGFKGATTATGTAVPGVTQKKGITHEERIQDGINSLKRIFGDALEDAAESRGVGLDAFARHIVEQKNIGAISTDFREMLNYRALMHSRIMGRGAMIRQFKEFGINVGFLKKRMEPVEQAQEFAPGDKAFTMPTKADKEVKEMAEWIDREGFQAGLRKAQDPALEGYVFDSAVADIIDKVYDVTRTGQRDVFTSFMRGYTNLWKGAATFTPRFHMRNLVSNNITGFLKHGMRWFNSYIDAFVATIYALNPQKHMDVLTNILKKNDGFVTSRLNKRYGDFTLKELAEIMREKGVVSERTMGFDPVEMAEMARGKKPVGERVFAASRYLGDRIENHARVNSFLLDFTGAGSKEVDIDYAAREARRWFIDYGDLTDFEKERLKPFVPFYTWIRKNLANQVSGSVLFADAYSVIPKTKDLFASDEDFEYDLLPEWMSAEWIYPVNPIGFLADTADFVGAEKYGSWLRERENIMLYQPDIPVLDLNMVPISFDPESIIPIPRFEPDIIMREIGSASHPGVKTIAEWIAGKDFFRDRILRDEMGEWEMAIAPDLFQYLSAAELKAKEEERFGPLALLDGISRLMGWEGGIGIEMKSSRDGNRQVITMDARLERLLSNNIPTLKTLEEALQIPQMVPQIEEFIEENTGKKDVYSGTEDFLKRLSFISGIRLREIDKEYLAEEQQREFVKKAERKRLENKEWNPESTKRRERYWKSDRERNKMLSEEAERRSREIANAQ